MKSQKFANLLRVANCLTTPDFMAIFGEDFEHYQNKMIGFDRNVAKFIMYLDSGNLIRFYNHIEVKLEAMGEG